MEKAGRSIMSAIRFCRTVSGILSCIVQCCTYGCHCTMFSVTLEEEKLVLGGEAALWAEYVDATNIISRLFPFVGAVAERLWSPANSSTTADAKHRLDEHRCRLLWFILQKLLN